MTRATKEVFEDHLATREAHDLAADIARNYAEDCVIMTRVGSFHGHAGITEIGERLQHELPGGTYQYNVRSVEGRMAFLIWSARAGETTVDDGADSFLIEDGKIKVQTIYYSLRRPGPTEL